jgi:ParB family chromosome partitioning protein
VARRSGLGKGLGAILPDTPVDAVPGEGRDGAPDEPEGTGALREVPVHAIRPNRFQPRAAFDDGAIAALAASISQLGVLQPVLVRPVEGGFELIAGERRWRAARQAGLTSIPAVVRTIDDDASLEQALVENLHREDLNPLEEAAGYQQLIDEFGLTQEQVAERVGKSRSAVANMLRLLLLPPTLQAMLVDGRLTAGHARALLACEDEGEQGSLATRVVHENLSVRQTEEAVRRLVASKFANDDEPPPPGRTRPAAVLELEQLLGDLFDTRVQVAMGARRGKITIEFATIEDLERIYGVMTSSSTAREEDDAADTTM